MNYTPIPITDTKSHDRPGIQPPIRDKEEQVLENLDITCPYKDESQNIEVFHTLYIEKNTTDTLRIKEKENISIASDMYSPKSIKDVACKDKSIECKEIKLTRNLSKNKNPLNILTLDFLKSKQIKQSFEGKYLDFLIDLVDFISHDTSKIYLLSGCLAKLYKQDKKTYRRLMKECVRLKNQ